MSGKELLEGPSWKWVAMCLIAVIGFFGTSFYNATVSGEKQLNDRVNQLERRLQEDVSEVRSEIASEIMSLNYRLRRLEEARD